MAFHVIWTLRQASHRVPELAARGGFLMRRMNRSEALTEPVTTGVEQQNVAIRCMNGASVVRFTIGERGRFFIIRKSTVSLAIPRRSGRLPRGG